MPTINQETWYYLHRATTPTNINEAEDLLNTMQIFKTGNIDGKLKIINKVINGTSVQVYPIPTLNYIIIVATKIFITSSGTYTLTLESTSAYDIILYLRDESTNNVTTYTISGAANTGRVQNISFSSNREYTLVMVQTNTTTNNTLFIRSTYSGIYLPRNKAYTGGNGVTLNLSASTVAAVGDYKYSARTADFDGWLLCDGRAVYRDAYPDLFQIIGTNFGSGNGTTTFNLPDGRGRVTGVIGTGSGLTARSLGNSVGAETHTLTTSQIPSHSHTGTVDSNGSHVHTYVDAYFAENTGTGASQYGTKAATDTDNTFFYRTADGSYSTTPSGINTSTAGDHTHTFTTDGTGSGQSHNNMQPTLFIGNLFICAEI